MCKECECTVESYELNKLKELQKNVEEIQIKKFNIDYKNNIKLDDYVSKLTENDKIIFWYVGPRGLLQSCMKFYKPILDMAQTNNTQSYLLDFSAWGRLYNLKYSLDMKSDLKDTNLIKMIFGCEFFEFINCLLKDDQYVEILREIIQRPEIYKASEEYPNCGIKLDEVFHENAEIRKIIDMSLDCSKVYSCFQYIEFLYIVYKIVNDTASMTHNLHFLLPNDEDKYYPKDLLKQDLEKFMWNFNVKVNIHLGLFAYGKKSNARPYIK